MARQAVFIIPDNSPTARQYSTKKRPDRSPRTQANTQAMKISNAFRVFRIRDYNLYFTGMLVSRIGTWMQRTAVTWVIYQMTDSVLMVGVATFVEQFPSFILSPAGGIAADKYSRYKILLITQGVSALQALLLTVAYATGYGSLWVMLLLSFILGVAFAYDVPARQALINDIVHDNEQLPSALAMNASMNNFTRLIGPVLAGIVLAKHGATICFAANAASFLIVIACIQIMHAPPQERIPRKAGLVENLREGWRYMLHEREIRHTITLSLMLFLLIMTYNTLQPYFADNVFTGVAAYGYINAATGLGALISTLYIASQENDIPRFKRHIFTNLVVLGFGLAVMSFVRDLRLYLLMSALCGFCSMSLFPTFNIIVQTLAVPQMRGRMISFLAMTTFGALPVGSLVIGWVADITGTEWCQVMQGLFSIATAAIFFKFLFGRDSR